MAWESTSVEVRIKDKNLLYDVSAKSEKCEAMEQSGYISEWQKVLLTLTSLYPALFIVQCFL